MTTNALKALLGVLAVAGYQNRDKIGEILQNLRSEPQRGANGQPQTGGGLGDILRGLGRDGDGLAGLGGLLNGSAAGGLSGGLGDLLRRFEQKGHGETAQSWVQTGENRPIDDRQLSEVLGPEILSDLSARTGLSPEEIVSRLSRDLPTAVNDLTPEGKLPSDADEIGSKGQASVPLIKPLTM